MGPFNFVLMASSESAHKDQVRGDRLPFFSQYGCEGASVVDVLAQEISRLPGSHQKMFGYYPPPPSYDGNYDPTLGRVAGSRRDPALDIRAFLFPVLHQATVRSIIVAPSAAGGICQWPCYRRGLREWKYPKWAIRAYEVDFGRNR